MTEPPSALERYTHAMRRRQAVYYGVVAVIVVALGVIVGVAWSNGEAAHTTLHQVARAPGTVTVQAPSIDQQLAWRTADRIAIGTPQWRGAIITYSKHTVGGRDAHTGKQTWSYTRTDREVCTAAQLNGRTVVVYNEHGNCDEVSAFDSGTGARRWTRTLDKDGMPLDGVPSYQVTDFTMMITSPSVIYALDPVTGLDRWTYQRPGCRIGGAVLGTAGALISQNCIHPKCAKVKFCGSGPQLFLRDGVSGRGDDNKPNADQIKWIRLADTDVPVSADQLISAAGPDQHILNALAQDTGKQARQIALNPTPSTLDGVVAIPTTTDEIIWAGGYAYAILPDSDTPQWTAATSVPPSVVSTTDQESPALSTARISIPTASGVGILDGNDGRLVQQLSLTPPPAPGSTVYPLGTGFLVTGGSGTVAYR